ncbi:hypothetical protein [Burkholderia gladioli]|nr:hypothetical protein [Burkholderia gladioli]
MMLVSPHPDGECETHKMRLDHYQQTKNLLVCDDTRPIGLF